MEISTTSNLIIQNISVAELLEAKEMNELAIKHYENVLVLTATKLRRLGKITPGQKEN